MAAKGRFVTCTLPSVVTRTTDVPGAWVAECVPLGVVTQGDSLQNAIEMLVEAVDLVVEDDLSRGLDPLRARKPLPGSTEELAAFMSRPMTSIDVSKADDSVAAVLVMVNVVRPQVSAMTTEHPTAVASGCRVDEVDHAPEKTSERYLPIGSFSINAAA